MSRSISPFDSLAGRRPPGRARTAIDIAIVLLLVGIVIAISADAPTHIYAYAQPWNIGAALGMLQSGDWLLPRNQMGVVPRKGQLYTWLLAGSIKLTASYEQFVFRLPSVVASLVMGVLVYFLAASWVGRGAALLGACLWVTINHMHKLMYLATTDMLLTLWITVGVLCADKLLFHPVASSKRARWVVLFWAAMILAALTKGWGIVNLSVLGGLIALATAVRPGFAVLRRAGTTAAKLGLLARLVGRRWWRAIRVVRVGWGLIALVVVVGAVLTAMILQGGQEFRQTLYFELWQRISGTGPSPPAPARAPVIGHLLYYTLPASLFALCALGLVGPRLWFSRRSVLSLPLCLVLSVVVPFALAHGFRPDYLLPCYPAVAMMGAWAIQQVARRGRSGGARFSLLRHVIATAPVVIAAALLVVPLIYLLYPVLPDRAQSVIQIPSGLLSWTWWGLVVCVGLGAAILIGAIHASVSWKVRRLGVAGVVGMLGVFYVYTHAVSSHAAGDGEAMVNFARRIDPIIGDDKFAVYHAEKLCTELFLGRFGKRISSFDALRRTDANWLITCDWGLKQLPGSDGRKGFRPSELGRIRFSSISIETDRNYGKAYLIELPQDR